MEGVRNLFRTFDVKELKNKIPMIKKDFTKIGEGRNAVSYIYVDKETKNNKTYSIKQQGIFHDTAMVAYNSENCLITQTFINEVIINEILTKIKLHDNKDLKLRKIYGFMIDNDDIYIFGKYFEFAMEEIYNKITNESLTLLLIHILFHLMILFEGDVMGYHGDIKFRNILVYKTTKKSVKYVFKGEEYDVKVDGYLPVLIDFGSSSVYYINKKRYLIERHTLYKNDKINYKQECNKKYQKHKNLQDFMQHIGVRIKRNEMNRNILVDEYYKNNKFIGIYEFLSRKNIHDIYKVT